MTLFSATRAADALDDTDAKQLGQLLFLELHPHRQNAHVLREKIEEMISLMNVLRAAQAKYRFIDAREAVVVHPSDHLNGPG